MKLVIAVVHDEDVHRLMGSITDGGFGVTVLSSTGGFLKNGNTTLMIGVSEKQVPEVLELIRNNCKSRKEVVSTGSMMGDNSYMSFPIEVNVGGATVFVLQVDEQYKL